MKKKKMVWEYNTGSGELLRFGKVVAVFYDDNGRPYFGKESEADTLGKLVEAAMNRSCEQGD